MPATTLSTGGSIGYDFLGIGDLIHRNRLQVPPNQREYSWELKQVKELFEDISAAISSKKPSHFLGTVVLTGGVDASVKEVADGQQRLATSTILLAAIRDYFVAENDRPRAGYVENLLFTTDLRTAEIEPKLTLNIDDREFFRAAILCDITSRKIEAKKPSHQKLLDASKEAAEHLRKITTPFRPHDRIEVLNNWVEFFEKSAQVIVLTVPDDLNAFVMFETLNDRGLKTSQADLLKNYLFSESDKRISEAQQHWSAMAAILEPLAMDEPVMAYLRHFATAKYGPTRERDVFATLKKNVQGKTNAIQFINLLSSYAEDYAAILNPAHSKWHEYDPSIRRSIQTISMLSVEMIRPLLLSIAKHFKPKEAVPAFRNAIAWIVRFFIVGGARGGTLESAYAGRAVEICNGKITTAKELQAAMRDVVPEDALFQAEFATAKVSKAHLARYYLRALELTQRRDKEPEFIPNDDQSLITLEHVLPQNPGKSWGSIRPEVASAFYKRLGNLVLLKAKANSTIGNLPFDQKKAELSSSTFKLTEWAGQQVQWRTEEIEERQRKLAELAVTTWSIK